METNKLTVGAKITTMGNLVNIYFDELPDLYGMLDENEIVQAFTETICSAIDFGESFAEYVFENHVNF